MSTQQQGKKDSADSKVKKEGAKTKSSPKKGDENHGGKPLQSKKSTKKKVTKKTTETDQCFSNNGKKTLTFDDLNEMELANKQDLKNSIRKAIYELENKMFHESNTKHRDKLQFVFNELYDKINDADTSLWKKLFIDAVYELRDLITDTSMSLDNVIAEIPRFWGHEQEINQIVQDITPIIMNEVAMKSDSQYNMPLNLHIYGAIYNTYRYRLAPIKKCIDSLANILGELYNDIEYVLKHCVILLQQGLKLNQDDSSENKIPIITQENSDTILNNIINMLKKYEKAIDKCGNWDIYLSSRTDCWDNNVKDRFKKFRIPIEDVLLVESKNMENLLHNHLRDTANSAINSDNEMPNELEDKRST
jgi:hypothetical protein